MAQSMTTTDLSQVRLALMNLAIRHDHRQIKLSEHQCGEHLSSITVTTQATREESCGYEGEVTDIFSIARAHGVGCCIQASDEGPGLEFYLY